MFFRRSYQLSYRGRTRKLTTIGRLMIYFFSFFFQGDFSTPKSPGNISDPTISNMSLSTTASYISTAAIQNITDNTTSPHPPIFLQTSVAQGIAGTFAVAAIIITCHQVSVFKFIIYLGPRTWPARQFKPFIISVMKLIICVHSWGLVMARCRYLYNRNTSTLLLICAISVRDVSIMPANISRLEPLIEDEWFCALPQWQSAVIDRITSNGAKDITSRRLDSTEQWTKTHLYGTFCLLCMLFWWLNCFLLPLKYISDVM